MYSEKVGGKYCADSECLMGKHQVFSKYIQEFGEKAIGHGLDIGAGPDSCNGKFFKACSQLDGSDIEEKVVESFDSKIYKKKFVNNIGVESLPYEDESLDFVVCSCVIHHLETIEELKKALKQMIRVLRKNGKIFLMYKAGVHGTKLTHFHKIFNQYRTVVVYDNKKIDQFLQEHGMQIQSEEKLADLNWVPYVCTIAIKKNV